MANVLEMKNIYKKYGEKHTEVIALKELSFAVQPGEFVAVIGPSGSGKSTFLRCLNQLEEASSGDIIIDGANLTDKNTDINQVRQHIGMVFQHFNLFPHLSILENIVLAPTDLGRLSKDEAEKKALELLERVGLADKKDAYPDSLSGGQKQRVAIARALAMNPDIMLFDEP
ncbi:amino acid ABC transporter ATP-binding protein, partial [Enterococcus mundtii]|uniref:amino acid ABC transporter ATP-binding protein n=1 Tax=Enterococcus mundtii TaxID=53346 RepID=UPI00129C1E2F